MGTIREIAKKAGVSIATVSKVLNELPGISDKTRAAVLVAAKELNYRPNLYARNLKTGSCKTLGILVEDITVFNAPDIIDGIGVTCESSDYHYILTNMRFNKRFGHNPGYEKEKVSLVNEMIDEMLSKQVDGIIYVGCHNYNIAYLSEKRDTKFVCAYCFSENSKIPSVIYDDREGGYQVAQLLVSKGHRKIGIAAGLKDSFATNNRLLGFQEALFKLDIPYNPHLTIYGEWEHDHGFSIAPILINEGVTAIFAHNDLIAMGILDYCNQNNIEIGKDISLIGFDNREITTVCRPTLSTVSLPLFEIGRMSAEIILDMIEKNITPEDLKHMLPCNLIERESISQREESKK